jgi:hypothetical protein
MPGLDPGIHQSSEEHFSKKMDCRVKPGNDEASSNCTLCHDSYAAVFFSETISSPL